jgi:hypothetical protein
MFKMILPAGLKNCYLVPNLEIVDIEAGNTF